MPFSLILATIVYRERPGVLQYAGIAVAFVGVYMLGGDPASAPSVPHLLMVVTSAFAWALANIIIKRIGPINVFVLNAWFAVFALPQFLLASLLFEHGQIAGPRRRRLARLGRRSCSWPSARPSPPMACGTT